MMRVCRFGLVAVVSIVTLPTAHAAGIQPADLSCEYLANPLGIDTPEPRLSWTLRAVPEDQRGQVQTAYQVLVAGSEEALKAGRGDLWDSGKVTSDRCADVVYAGRKLASNQRCWWKVRVWDKDGAASAWSAPASWSMGILDAQEWQGKWIGYNQRPAAWRNSIGGEKPWGQEAPSPILRKTFEVRSPVKAATVSICGLGYYELHLNGGQGRRPRPRPGLHPLRPARALRHLRRDRPSRKQGPNAVGVMLGNGWYNPHAKDVWDFDKAPWRDRPTLLVQLRIDVRRRHACRRSPATPRGGPDRPGRLRQHPQRRELRRPAGEARLGHGRVRRFRLGRGRDRRRAEGQAPRPDDAAQPVIQTITPVKLTEPKPGVYVFDIGQNLAGWARLQGLRPGRAPR